MQFWWPKTYLLLQFGKKKFWPHRCMYIMYIYGIMEQNSLNCPGEQLWGLLVKILPKHMIDENMDEPCLKDYQWSFLLGVMGPGGCLWQLNWVIHSNHVTQCVQGDVNIDINLECDHQQNHIFLARLLTFWGFFRLFLKLNLFVQDVSPNKFWSEMFKKCKYAL